MADEEPDEDGTCSIMHIGAISGGQVVAYEAARLNEPGLRAFHEVLAECMRHRHPPAELVERLRRRAARATKTTQLAEVAEQIQRVIKAGGLMPAEFPADGASASLFGKPPRQGRA